ncbi:hypothetical protein ACLESO_29860 [Pyxidicoccus sp. 3LG]
MSPRLIASLVAVLTALVTRGAKASELPPDAPLAEPLPSTGQAFIDVVPAAQAAINAADFEGVFSRIGKSSSLSSAKELEPLLEAFDNATSAEAVAALIPYEARQQHPDVIAFIESGTLPPALTVRTGEQTPPTPAAGGALLPGLPPPYGVYTPNPTNNWGMPNSPTGGCGPMLVRGDGLYFDFTRACRQHDLAYRWTPVPPSQRQAVESRLLQEMMYDCSLRGLVTSRLCAARALIYWTATTVLGGFSYGARQTPGYNAPGTAETWPVPYSSCAQASHVSVYTEGQGPRVPRNKSLYFTGVVRPHSRVRFQLIDAWGNVALEHMTHASRTNCVIHHEPERVSASLLPNGVYSVRALYTPWETEQATQVELGSLEIYTPTGTTTCNQFSHAWVHGTQYPVTVGGYLYPTGVVRKYTSVRFDFVNAQGQIAYQHQTRSAGSNCVIAHEPEVRSTYGWAPGVYQIRATYVEWETDQVVTKPVGTLDLRAWTGGGGGGGGGECLNSPHCL